MNRQEDAPVLPEEFIRPVITLKQLWVMVWAYRKWIGAFVLITTIATGVASVMLPKTYEATATLLVAFQIDDRSGREFSPLLAESYIATQQEFIESPRTMFGVVDKMRLADNPEYTSGYFGNGTPESIRDWAMHSLNAKINVSKGKDSHFMYINADDHDPAMAAELANAVADSYLQVQESQVAKPAKERADRYGEQLEALKKKVDETQAKVTAFREKAGMVSLDESQMDNSRLTELDRRLAEARAKRQAAELRLHGGGEGYTEVLSSSLVQNLKNQLSQKEAEMADLKNSLGTRHPQYIALQSEIVHLREQLNREIGVYGESARSEAESARSLESKLQKDLDDAHSKALESRSMQEDGARLVRELETATKVYQGALDNYDKVLMDTAIPTENASIVTRATPPVRHIRPLARKNVSLALIVSLMLAVGVSLVWDLFNRRVRCREDLERDLNTPVLAEIGSSHA